MLYIAIDPGLNGGIAHGWNGQEIEAVKMPVIKNGGKKTIDAQGLVELIQSITFKHRVACGKTLTAVEKVHAMPGQGVTSMFNFGYGCGLIEGILAAKFLPYEPIRPQTWQTVLGGIDKSLGKKRSIVYCQQKHPQLGKLTDGQADAVAMLDYLVQRSNLNGNHRSDVSDDPKQNSARPAKRNSRRGLLD